MPTCLSPLSVAEDSADAEQEEHQKTREGGSYRQRDCAVASFLQHLGDWGEKVTLFSKENESSVSVLSAFSHCSSSADLQTWWIENCLISWFNL